MSTYEVNFDGLVGPTHHYAGLAIGNLASVKHAHQPSNPRAAVKQGLDKMRLVMQLGIKQAILPPHPRPNLLLLQRLGFSGSTEKILQQAYGENETLLAACYSAASMWTANAATVSPSANCLDHRVHFSPANLISQFHRHQEAAMTTTLLQKIFDDEHYFVVHSPLPAVNEFADEGAANHANFCKEYGAPGVEFFVYGKQGFAYTTDIPPRYPARQSLIASEAIARRHGLVNSKVVFAQQNPAAIDAGVFHNDVIAVSNGECFFYHEQAFVNKNQVIADLRRATNNRLQCIEVKATEVSLAEAVQTYLFNSQLVSLPDNTMALIAPLECEQSAVVKNYLDHLLRQRTPIKKVYYVDCRQSMKNGGGPACLRLRVVLTEKELIASHPGVYLTEDLYQQLLRWADKHYRDRLTSNDFLDPHLVTESYAALDELTELLQLGPIYPFQL